MLRYFTNYKQPGAPAEFSLVLIGNETGSLISILQPASLLEARDVGKRADECLITFYGGGKDPLFKLDS